MVYSKVLQDEINKGMQMPKIKMNYEPMTVYRMIDIGKYPEPISRNHFNSYAEEGKLPKTFTYKWQIYSCSVFTNIKELETALKLPRKQRKIAKGTLLATGGSIFGPNSHFHCDWFLYENYDPSFENFEVI